MATETKRTVLGATNVGQVVVIEKDVEDTDAPLGQVAVTKKSFIVRQGVRTMIETDDEGDANSLAKILVKYNGIIEPGVDERPISEQGKVTPHEHRIPSHEVHVTSEPDKLLGDEPARVENSEAGSNAVPTGTPPSQRSSPTASSASAPTAGSKDTK